MKSITAVLLDKYPERPSKPLEFFKNQADHMHRSDAPTVKTGARAKYAADMHRMIVLDKIRPKNA